MWIQKQRGNVFLLLIPVALLGAIVGLLAPEAATGFQDVFIFRHRRPLLLSLSAILLLLGLCPQLGPATGRRPRCCH
jgi:hypothetical protein